MLKYFFIFNYLIQIIFALFYFKKYNNSLVLKLFVVFIGYSFITEAIGAYQGYYLKESPNFIYNTWNILNHLFYSLFFLSAVKTLNRRRLIIGLIILYTLFTIINISFFKDYFGVILLSVIIFGSLLIVAAIMIYYVELLNGNDFLNIKYSLFFWISVGVLLSNIILIPVWAFAEFFSFQGIFRFLIFVSNILMSICFITGFIVSKKGNSV